MKNSRINILPLILIALLFTSFLVKKNITTLEKENLLLMLEEEKLAHDVYIALEEKWDHQVFSNISQAEARHFEIMLDLAFEYELPKAEVIESNGAGIFENKEISDLYIALTNEGANSLKDAFLVGARIEELDIKDLIEVMANTENKDMRSAYQYLLNGSENHLRAFVRNLNNLGNDYHPTILDQETFESIIASNASGAQGKGMKKGMGNQNCKGEKKCNNNSGNCCKNGGEGCKKSNKS